MSHTEQPPIRLGDRILSALELAIDQGDLEICELLLSAIERTLTRKSSKPGFVERREYPPELDAAFEKIKILRDKAGY